MSTNEINIEAVNARAREEETPMTNILSVEEVVDNFGKQFDELKMKPSKKSMPGLERELLKDFMRKALTADRLALLTELEESIQTIDFYGWNEQTQSKIKEKVQAHLDELINSTK